MKGESLLLSGIGVVVVRRCRLCVPDSPGGASRFVCDIHNINKRKRQDVAHTAAGA